MVTATFCYCVSLILHQECCTFSNGEYVKAGLDELEIWCNEATVEVVMMCRSFSLSPSLSRHVFSLLDSSVSFFEQLRPGSDLKLG